MGFKKIASIVQEIYESQQYWKELKKIQWS